MEEEEAVQIFDLVVRNRMLPEKLKDLVPLSFIGQAAVEFYRSKVKAIENLNTGDDQRKATLGDGQDAGKMLLAIEDRIGELSLKEPQARGKMVGHGGSTSSGKPPKHERLGIKTEERMKQSQSIHRNPDVVAKVIAEAEDNEDIPTRTAVINRISYEKERKRRQAVEGKRQESKALISLDQMKYLSALDTCISTLPQKPPKTWNETAFAEAKAKAKIIIRRLEVFTNGQD